MCETTFKEKRRKTGRVLNLILHVFLLTGCSDIVSVNFDDWEAVKTSGTMERGWVPHWLPREATNIKERHNLDTNAIALSFKYLSIKHP